MFTLRHGSESWEEEFIRYALRHHDGLKVFVRGQNSQQKEAKSGMTNEMPLLFAGFGLLFIYISLMTGKFSMLRNRYMMPCNMF